MTNQPPGSTERARRTSHRARVAHLASCAALGLLPVLFALALLQLVLGVSVTHYVPVHWDEFSYWRQIQQFAEHGFGGGLHTFQEQEGNVPPFGAWGPGFPVLFGTVGAVVGWGISSPPLFNMVAVWLAVTVAAVIVRPRRQRALLFTLLLLGFAPLPLYLVSGMQEPFHFGIAIVTAALLARIWARRHDGTSSRGMVVATALVIGVAALIRPTWAFAFIALVLVSTTGAGKARNGAWLALSIAASATFLLLFAWWAAPLPYTSFSIAYPLLHDYQGVGPAVDLVLDNTRHNISVLIDPDPKIAENYIARLTPVFNAWIIFVVLSVTTGIVAAVVRSSATVRLLGATFAIVVGPVLFVLTLYELSYSAGTRVVLAPMLCACMLLVFAGRRWMVLVPAAVAISGLLLTPVLVDDFRSRNEINYLVASRDEIAVQSRLASRSIVFDGSQPRWCNTVLFSITGSNSGLQPYQLLRLPSGIGIGYDYDHTFDGDLESRYVIADPVAFDALPLHIREDLDRVEETSVADVFINRSAECT